MAKKKKAAPKKAVEKKPDTRFKPGNRFWEMRSKHGRDKLFASPELMWAAACEYFKYVEDNPQMRSEAKTVSLGGSFGSSIELAEIPVKQPFTLIGLCLYLNCSSSYFRSFKSTISKENSDFLTIIEKIEETIYNQKFSGAASGFFNANIIARDLGLKDHSEVAQTVTLAPDLTPEEKQKYRDEFNRGQ